MSPVRYLSAGFGFALLICGTSVALSADDVITLGATVSLTGKYAVNGTNTKNGYELAVRQVNNKGGVQLGDKTYAFKVRYYDDRRRRAAPNSLKC